MAKKRSDTSRELRQNFSKFFKDMNNEAELAVIEAANKVLDRSQELVPVDTGALKSSGRIEKQRIKKAGFGVEFIAEVAYGGDFSVPPTQNAPDGVVPYAVAVHEGTATMQARPFLQKAIQEMESEIARGVRQRLSQVARKSGRPGR